MSASLILNMTSTWNETFQQSGNPNNVSRNEGSMSLQKTYADGTGTGLFVNQVYSEYRTLLSGESRTYDFRSVTGLYLGFTSVTKTFSKLKAIEFKNYASLTGHNITINVNTASGLKLPFGYPTGNIVLGPGSHFGINDLFGWTLNSGHCALTVANTANTGVSYEINLGGIQ